MSPPTSDSATKKYAALTGSYFVNDPGPLRCNGIISLWDLLPLGTAPPHREGVISCWDSRCGRGEGSPSPYQYGDIRKT